MSLTSYWLRVKEEYGYVLIQTYNLLLNFPQGIVYLIDVMDLLIVTSYKIIFKPWIFLKKYLQHVKYKLDYSACEL